MKIIIKDSRYIPFLNTVGPILTPVKADLSMKITSEKVEISDICYKFDFLKNKYLIYVRIRNKEGLNEKVKKSYYFIYFHFNVF